MIVIWLIWYDAGVERCEEESHWMNWQIKVKIWKGKIIKVLWPHLLFLSLFNSSNSLCIAYKAHKEFAGLLNLWGVYGTILERKMRPVLLSIFELVFFLSRSSSSMRLFFLPMTKFDYLTSEWKNCLRERERILFILISLVCM
jgi:hypothetical protein